MKAPPGGRPLTKTEGPALTAAEIGPVDVVLLSHDQHADNLDPAGRDVAAVAPITLTTASAAGRLGSTARPLSTWQQVRLARPACRDTPRVRLACASGRRGPASPRPSAAGPRRAGWSGSPRT